MGCAREEKKAGMESRSVKPAGDLARFPRSSPALLCLSRVMMAPPYPLSLSLSTFSLSISKKKLFPPLGVAVAEKTSRQSVAPGGMCTTAELRRGDGGRWSSKGWGLLCSALLRDGFPALLPDRAFPYCAEAVDLNARQARCGHGHAFESAPHRCSGNGPLRRAETCPAPGLRSAITADAGPSPHLASLVCHSTGSSIAPCLDLLQ